MIVYGDVLFVLNLLLDYGLLLAVAKIAGTAFVRLRLLLGALFGAVYALLVFVPQFRFLSAFPVRLLMCGAMVAVAFGFCPGYLRLLFVFCAVSAALGGGVLALTTVGSATLYRGVVTSGADLTAVLLVGSAGCIVMGFLFRRWGSGVSYADIEVTLGGRSTRFRALVDTGNTLTDRNNGRVIVADWQVVGQLLPGFTQADAQLPGGGFERWSGRLGASRVRLLSYRTVGTSDGLLLALRPERVVVNGRERPGLLIAASANPISGGGLYQALIGADEIGGMI